MGEARETLPVDSTARFEQGDILSFEDATSSDLECEGGVIITADCDLANAKADGIISYLPMYHIRTYLNKFWAPRHLSKLAEESITKAAECCGLSISEKDDLSEWLKSTSVDHVFRKFARSNIKKADLQSLERHLTRAKLSWSGSEPLGRLAALSRLEKDSSAYLAKQLKGARTSIADSTFLVSDVCGDHRIGFIVKLNRVLALREEDCFKVRSERLARGADGRSAHRMCRLSPAFKYRIAQLFSIQFSRIGLPDELTEMDQFVVAGLADELLGDV